MTRWGHPSGSTRCGAPLAPRRHTPLTGARVKGYALSKYVSDVMVLNAAARGLPVAVYRCCCARTGQIPTAPHRVRGRPGRVTGDSSTGVTSTEDFMARFLKVLHRPPARPPAPCAR